MRRRGLLGHGSLFGQSTEPLPRRFLGLRHGIPSHNTFSRVLRLLDPVAFEACFVRFMCRFAEALQGVVAVDAKTLRRSFDKVAGTSPLHMLHAWSVGLQVQPRSRSPIDVNAVRGAPLIQYFVVKRAAPN